MIRLCLRGNLSFIVHTYRPGRRSFVNHSSNDRRQREGVLSRQVPAVYTRSVFSFYEHRAWEWKMHEIHCERRRGRWSRKVDEGCRNCEIRGVWYRSRAEGETMERNHPMFNDYTPKRLDIERFFPFVLGVKSKITIARSEYPISSCFFSFSLSSSLLSPFLLRGS